MLVAVRNKLKSCGKLLKFLCFMYDIFIFYELKLTVVYAASVKLSVNLVLGILAVTANVGA